TPTLDVVRTKKEIPLPVRGSPGAAGYDLYAAEDTVVPAHGHALISTGLSMKIPPGHYGRVAPRSGLAVKKKLTTGAGVIDSDFRGEVKILLFNLSGEEFIAKAGERVAQLILEKISTPPVREVKSLDETKRADKGFGSTGTSSIGGL
ncbi:dUTPase-like protein, partial [Lanmaoa asiatica]